MSATIWALCCATIGITAAILSLPHEPRPTLTERLRRLDGEIADLEDLLAATSRSRWIHIKYWYAQQRHYRSLVAKRARLAKKIVPAARALKGENMKTSKTTKKTIELSWADVMEFVNKFPGGPTPEIKDVEIGVKNESKSNRSPTDTAVTLSWWTE